MDTPPSEEKYSSPKPPAGGEAHARGAPPPLSTSLQRAVQPQPAQYVPPDQAPPPPHEPTDTADGIPTLDFMPLASQWPEQTTSTRATLWRVAAIAALAIIVVVAAVVAFKLLGHGATAAIGGTSTSNTATPHVAATATTLVTVAATATTVTAPATSVVAPTLAPLPATATPVPPSATATATPRPAIAFDNGFTAPNLMRLNGKANFNGASLRLTHSDGGEISSAYYTTPMPVGSFTTTFTYQALNAYADGFTFIMQNDSPTAIGNGGSDLGFVNISKSVVVLFKFYNEPKYAPIGNDTGMSPNGQMPNRTHLNVPLYSGHLLSLTIQYNGSTLSVTTRDTVTGSSANQSYGVNIPAVVGGGTAYVGFTGATGLNDSTQDIVSWHYQS